MRDGCAEPDIAHLSHHRLLSMRKCGWLVNEIQEAYEEGVSYPEIDLTAGAVSATRFVHPTTGKSLFSTVQQGESFMLAEQASSIETEMPEELLRAAHRLAGNWLGLRQKPKR